MAPSMSVKFGWWGWEHIRYLSLTGVSKLPDSRPLPSSWLNLQHSLTQMSRTGGFSLLVSPVIQSEGVSFDLGAHWKLTEHSLRVVLLGHTERWWPYHCVSVCLENLFENFLLLSAVLILVFLIFPNLDTNGDNYIWNKKPGECAGGIVLSRICHEHWMEVEMFPFRCQDTAQNF